MFSASVRSETELASTRTVCEGRRTEKGWTDAGLLESTEGDFCRV